MRFVPRTRKQNSGSDSNASTGASGVQSQLPLGSNAYRSPLFATVERSGSNRAAWVVVTCAVLLSASIVGFALAFRPTTEAVVRDDDARVAPSAVATSKPSRRVRSSPALPAAIAVPETSDLVFATSPNAVENSARPLRARRASVHSEARRGGRRERKAAPPAASDSQLPEFPARAAVIASMTRVTPAALACFGEQRGVAKVTLFVRGKSGRVIHARVSGLAGSAGTCLARVVRRATFPKFQKERMEISYPFQR